MMDIGALKQIEDKARSLQKLEVHPGRTGNEELRYSWSRVCGIEVRRVYGGPDMCLLVNDEPTKRELFVAGADGADKEERMEALLTEVGEQLQGSSVMGPRDRALEELRARNFARDLGCTQEAIRVDSDLRCLPVPRIVVHRKTGRVSNVRAEYPDLDPIAALADLCSILRRQVPSDGKPAQPVAATPAREAADAQGDSRPGTTPTAASDPSQAPIAATPPTEQLLRSDSSGTVGGERLESQERSGVDDGSRPGAVVRREPHGEASIAQQKAERNRRLTDAIERWRPKVCRKIPFAWIYKAAGVHRGEAYQWKNGQLPDSSIMSKHIEEVLEGAEPPPKTPQISVPTSRTGRGFSIPTIPTIAFQLRISGNVGTMKAPSLTSFGSPGNDTLRFHGRGKCVNEPKLNLRVSHSKRPTSINSALKVWIDNVIVPALADQWTANQRSRTEQA